MLQQGEYTIDRKDKQPLRWRVPVTLRGADGKDVRTLVDGNATVDLPGCAGPVLVNAGPGGKDDTGVVDGYEGERLAERLAKLPVPAEFKHFVRGKSTVDEIEALVNHLDVSVLVIGLRRRTAVGKLLLGSTAQEILMTVSCPVLCVKAA